MGIFYKQRKVFNRAPVDITVRFDGQDITLPPGENIIAEMAIPYGKNQNPIMGSQDPTNPHISGGRYLLGVVGDWDGQPDDCTPLTEEEWQEHLGQPQRIDSQAAFEEVYGADPKAKLITLGKGRKSTANSRSDAGGAPKGLAEFTRKDS